MFSGPSNRDYLIAILVVLVVGGGLGIGVEHLISYLFHHISFH
jgi:hypothetical protein